MTQEFTGQSINFLTQLLHSYIGSLSSQNNDIAAPLIESLYLILYGIDKLGAHNYEVKKFPIPLSDFEDSSIINHMFGGFDFVNDLKTRVESLMKKPKTVKKMEIKETTELHTVHTIGEKEKAEVDKAIVEQENRQIAKVFPTYKDEQTWKIVESKRKKVVVGLFLEWEFACGHLKTELKSRFLSILPNEYHGIFLHKPLEIHMKCQLEKYDMPIANFNFYSDANPHEAMQAYTPLILLLQKLTFLTGTFPDHAILQELQYLSYKVLKRPLFTTPLMQIVAAMDLIVQKVEDWEHFAHEGISLKKEVNEIYAVLRKWRDLELRSWEGILEAKKKAAEEKDAKLWARLFLVIFVEKSQGKDLYLALDQYIRGASLGLFDLRMNLLKDFARMAEPSQQLPIYHIYTFYQYFFDKYEKIFSEHKKEIENRLKEILTLAKYKISNYLLWKDAVSKSHRQLNAMLNKYKGILKLSFEKEVLEKHWESYKVNVIETPPICEVEDVQNSFEVLTGKIFERLGELKLVSDQSLKRTGLMDLLNELKNEGFSQYYRKWDSNNIFEMPILQAPPAVDITKHEKYFYGCIDKMTILQFSITKTQELLPEDKEKCLNLSTDMLCKLISLRSKISLEFSQFAQQIALPPALRQIVSDSISLIKSCKFQLYQEELNGSPIIPLLLPIFTNSLLDIEPCISSLTQLSKIPNFSSQCFSLLSLLTPQKIPLFSSENLSLYKSLSKLTYIVLSIFISLFTQGFCLPVETTEAEGGGDGTGLGEGRGNEDITNELEDEEQFNEHKGQEENKEEMGEGEGMDVREEFQGDEESAEASEAEDRLGEAEGNEMLMDKDQEVRDADGEVRESANPEMTDQQDVKDGILPEDRQGDLEDFEMQGKSEDDEDSASLSQDLMDVDKKSVSADMSEDEKNEEKSEEGEESEEKFEKKDREVEEKKGEHEGEDSGSEEEKKLEEFKNRERLEYTKEAYGNEDLKANTEKMIEGGEGGELQGSQQNIISKMRSEWSQKPQGPSEVGPESKPASAPTITDVQVVKTSEVLEIPESSSLYTYNDSHPDIAPAPSLENNSELPPISTQKTTDVSMEIALEHSSISSLPNDPKNKETLNPLPVHHFIEFTEGEIASKNVYKNKPDLEGPGEEPELPFGHMEIITGQGENIEEWLDLEKQTEKISQELCEQLRIILEPTKAKSLKGDYRTGKRINMKKVIAYIASQFRKDKIWLRRTRETGREYQVLIAIDDSFSMNQHGLGEIAKKGLAAIAQSLNKLEVGELGVAAIRQGLTLLHDFSSTFTAEHGAYVLSELQFLYGREAGNDMSYPNFVKQCYEFLSEKGDSDLQLVIVISDGRMNKQKVRPCLRKSQGIFYLFIIVDNQESSILDMKSTVIEKVAGKSTVKVYPYLEDFPFEYYVVVQSPELLVEVLADVVKQWFELLRN